MSFRIPDCHRLWSPFPELSATTLGPISGSYNPDPRTKKTGSKAGTGIGTEKSRETAVFFFTFTFTCFLSF